MFRFSCLDTTIYAQILALECCIQANQMSSLISECPNGDVWFHPIPDVLDLEGDLRCHFTTMWEMRWSLGYYSVKTFLYGKGLQIGHSYCSTSSNTGKQKSLQPNMYTRNFGLSFEELNNIPLFPSLLILRLSHSFCVIRVWTQFPFFQL